MQFPLPPRPLPWPRKRALVVAAAAVTLTAACEQQPDMHTSRTARGATVSEGAVVAATGPVLGPSFSEATRSGHARLAFFFVPASGFAYTADEGRLTGVTIELLRDFAGFVASTHGIALDIDWYEETQWADFYGYVRDSQGAVFGVGNVTITAARQQEIDFSPPYLNNVAVLVTHARTPELSAMHEIGTAFAGLTALPYPGTLHEARLESIRERWLPDMSERHVASNDELVALLADSSGYFGYLDVYNYWRARQAGLPLRRHPAGDDGSETFGVILPHGSDWTPVIRAFFETDGGYTAGVRFRDLLSRHLGEELAGMLNDS
jgi:ABC-type amino acid transport substrate-binding protein